MTEHFQLEVKFQTFLEIRKNNDRTLVINVNWGSFGIIKEYNQKDKMGVVIKTSMRDVFFQTTQLKV